VSVFALSWKSIYGFGCRSNPYLGSLTFSRYNSVNCVGKKKVLSEGDLREMVMPEEGQLLGVVTQMLGYDRLMVRCADGHDRVCRIRGKMKRRVWIKVGDVVLVAPWDFQVDSRGDILWRYTESQANWLRTQGRIAA
jgi:translation initiation factor 1A